MKSILMASLMLIATSANATERPSKVSNAAREAGSAWSTKNAIPVGKGLTLSDSKGCYWLIWEENEKLIAVLPHDSEGKPPCAGSMAK